MLARVVLSGICVKRRLIHGTESRGIENAV